MEPHGPAESSPYSSASPSLSSDVLVVGTGVSACLCAAALARRGARVVQIDSSGNYGGAYQTLRLSELLAWASEREEVGECPERGEGAIDQVPTEQLHLLLAKCAEDNALSLSCHRRQRAAARPSAAASEAKNDSTSDATSSGSCQRPDSDEATTDLYLSPTHFRPGGSAAWDSGVFRSRHASFFPFARHTECSVGRGAPDQASASAGPREPASPQRTAAGGTCEDAPGAPGACAEAEREADWQQREKEALLRPAISNGFGIDLLPRILYSSSPIVNILVECGAARYLEFRPLEAPVFVADLEIGPELFRWNFQTSEAGDADAEGSHERAALSPVERNGKRLRELPQSSHVAGGAQRAEEEDQAGYRAETAKGRRTEDAHSNGARAGPSGQLYEDAKSNRALTLRVESGWGNTQKEKSTLSLEAVPLNRSAIFGSSVLTLPEKRSLMKFVSGVASRFLSPQFLSAARCWGRRHASKGDGAQTAGRGTETGSGLSGNGERSEGEAASWEAFLGEHGLTERLQRYLTFGVCLSEFPMCGVSGANRAALLESPLEDSASAHRIDTRRTADACETLVWPATDGQKRLELFVQSLGVYGRQGASDSAWLYPLFGTSDLPQAFARVASLSEAVYMLRAGIQDIRVELGAAREPPAARDLAVAGACGAAGASASLNLAGEDFPCLWKAARHAGKEVTVRLTNGENVRTRLILFEPESLPSLATPVWRADGGACPGPELACDAGRDRDGWRGPRRESQPDLGQMLFEDASSLREDLPPREAIPSAAPPSGAQGACTGEAGRFPEGPGQGEEQAGGSRARFGEEAAAGEVAKGSEASLSSCHLIAICRKPVLDGNGFRMCVCTVRAEGGESQGRYLAEKARLAASAGRSNHEPRAHPRWAAARWPVHVLQTDASCATAPRDYTVLHLVHLGYPGVGPCEHCCLAGNRDAAASEGLQKGLVLERQMGTPQESGAHQRPGGERAGVATTRRQSGAAPCSVLREVLRSLLERPEGGCAARDCLFSCSFVFGPGRAEGRRQHRCVEQTRRRFEGFLRGLREEAAGDTSELACLDQRPSNHIEGSPNGAETRKTGQEDPAGAAAGEAGEGEAVKKAGDEKEEAWEARTEGGGGTGEASEPHGRRRDDGKGEEGEQAHDARGALGRDRFSGNGCGFMLLPSAPVTPFFSLLREPVACRDVLTSLLSRPEPLAVDEMVPKHAMQGLQDVEERQRLLNAPYEQLDKLGLTADSEVLSMPSFSHM
ncbi:hypothetical protein BESB_043120 [Besnoitia besnoiti]|uniref:GDP dissociation inhibitor n=1 Tax=Besnoitia besnoiti TaxID=94643 RepID=A0A2A9ML02_BESBE|nr:hypothetical protein BESB_043120 [Besnoitia besnoiti]PFH36120.1 hypothetical protein BESB_043120 [Besnoitia besnoiti]